MTKSIMALAILALPAFAAAVPAPAPLIVKSSGGGYTPPEWQRYESCQLYRDHVVITKAYGLANGSSVKLSHEVKITLDAGIDTLLASASKEKEVRSPNGLCDAPATMVTMHLAASKKEIQLFHTGGCGSDRIEREGPASSALRGMIDQFCPETYDYGDGHGPVQPMRQ